ncbi:apiosidase-like domain-containing protein, partial [Paenibacillus nasutitermitis]|uniref:apiosidase-like domain-containing protein n=1 Tax=Paenibacillus nasutitermitis TaxID=1652958 RepID=UPI00166AB315
YQDGTPFFYLADTHWFLSREKWGESNVPGTDSQFKTAIDKRKEQGFTAIQSHPDGHRLTMCNTGCTEIDLDKFRDYDQKVNYIAEQGLVHNMGIGAFHHTQEITAEGAERLGKYFAARYGAYPALWFTAQEVDGPLDMPKEEQEAVWMGASAAIEESDAYGQPQSVHMMPGVPKQQWAAQPWHDWFMTQGGHGTVLSANHYKRYWDYAPTKPFLESENNYEGLYIGITDKSARNGAYKS